MTNRFDYIAYTQRSAHKQAQLKEKFQELEKLVDQNVSPGRAKALVMTNLEEAYMWCGKGIRDEQLSTGEMSAPQEQRINS